MDQSVVSGRAERAESVSRSTLMSHEYLCAVDPMTIQVFLKYWRSRFLRVMKKLFHSLQFSRTSSKSFFLSVCFAFTSFFTIAVLFRRPSGLDVGLEMTDTRVSYAIMDADHQFFLSACVIVRQSSDIMPEFIVRNYMAGVDHFYIYGDDADDPAEVTRLRKLFSALNGIVTYISDGRGAPSDDEDPEIYVQMRMYRHCLEEFGAQSRWISFIDSDEFFETYALPKLEADPAVRPKRAFLHDILMRHEAFPVLCVRWRTALTNGRILPSRKGEFLHDIYPMTCKISMIDNGKLAYKKTVLQPRYVDLDASPKLDDAIHRGFSFKGPTSYTNFSCKTDLGKNLEPALHLVHYWSRDLTSYLRKVQRGRPRKTVPPRTLMDLFLRETMCEPDSTISSSHIRHEYVRKILHKLPFIPEAVTDLPSTPTILGAGVEKSREELKKGKNIHFCQVRVEKLLQAAWKGLDFASARYCKGRDSRACSTFQEGKPLRWPYPWAEYITTCDELGSNKDVFE